ncbi:MAG: DUF4962 domain-containing protein [Acidobacteria bacterium]|nr:DUF4962 domain-containing protein [Acidobacteriota bacterium]
MRSVIVNIFSNGKWRKYSAAPVMLVLASIVLAQSAAKDVTPFAELLARPVAVSEKTAGVHPRLFFGKDSIPGFRAKAKGPDRELWQRTLKEIETLKRPTPDPEDEDLYKSGLDDRKPGSISQYSFAFQITQTSLAYAVEQDERYLTAARAWTMAACEMPMWGYTYNKPNVDLPPAHLLYAVAFAYDLLYDKLSPAERTIIREKLLKQGRLMYDYFKYKPGKRYTYTQNHTWIPMAGLAIAAYAIMDEVPEAKQWAQLSRAVFERTMTAFATDGYFYESFHYFGFAFRWMIRYFDAHLAATGEDLYARMKPKFDGMKYFVMHSVLPDGKNVFDFADIGDGSLNRNGTSARESIESEYDILYRLAAVYRDAEAQAVGDYLRTKTELGTREPMWAFINRDPDIKPAPLSQIPLQYYFKDNDTVFWRSDWTKNAKAFAFRCSPPEGHHAARLAASIPDWRQNTGHAHPDANSFIIWANGKYLTGDTGYLGIKQTDDHNTLLFNGRGQEKEGVYEMFKDLPNARLDQIRIGEVSSDETGIYIRGEAAAAYFPDLGVRKFNRHFMYSTKGYFVVWDEIETEKPSQATFLLNADREVKLNGSTADFINGNEALRVVRVAPVSAASEVKPQTVQARGLPGSVDKGDLETRGVQLRSTADHKQGPFEFVHVLFPYRTEDAAKLPAVKAANGGKGFQVVFGDGTSETVCLGENCGGFRSQPGRIAIHSAAGPAGGPPKSSKSH